MYDGHWPANEAKLPPESHRSPLIMSHSEGVLHFDYRPQKADWILRTMTRLGESRNPRVRKVLETWGDGLGEVAGAIATRHRIVELALRRVNEAVEQIACELEANQTNVKFCLGTCSAFRLPGDLPYRLIGDIDSFIFETRSAYELVVRFSQMLLRELDSRKNYQPAQLHTLIAKAIAARGGDISWIESLRDARHLLSHETAAWPALKVKSLDPLRADPVFLTKNVALINDKSSFIEFGAVRDIYRGFCQAFDPIEEWLASEIQELDVS